jgi:hypothetical protein
LPSAGDCAACPVCHAFIRVAKHSQTIRGISMSRSAGPDRARLKATLRTLASRTNTAFLVCRRQEYTTSQSPRRTVVSRKDAEEKLRNPADTAVRNHAAPSNRYSTGQTTPNAQAGGLNGISALEGISQAADRAYPTAAGTATRASSGLSSDESPPGASAPYLDVEPFRIGATLTILTRISNCILPSKKGRSGFGDPPPLETKKNYSIGLTNAPCGCNMATPVGIRVPIRAGAAATADDDSDRETVPVGSAQSLPAQSLPAQSLPAQSLPTLDARSRTGRVREWLSRLSEIAAGDSPTSVSDFLEATLSKTAPPPLRSGDDGEEVGLAAHRALKAILIRAELKHDERDDAIQALVNAGVVRRTDMSVAEAVTFLRARRARTCVASPSAERKNSAVVRMLCAGMPVGHADPESVRSDPGGACEVIAACRTALEDSLARASALELLLRCSSAGVGLDADALLCPGHTGRELLLQAREIVAQVTGLPVCVF